MTEAQAKEGLALKHYACTWRDAQGLARPERNTGFFWSAVRRYYLELGGLFIEQLPPKRRALYFEGAPKA